MGPEWSKLFLALERSLIKMIEAFLVVIWMQVSTGALTYISVVDLSFKSSPDIVFYRCVIVHVCQHVTDEMQPEKRENIYLICTQGSWLLGPGDRHLAKRIANRRNDLWQPAAQKPAAFLPDLFGTFEVNAAQTSYQAEENEDITLEFLFTTKADTSPEPIEILCELLADDEHLKVFHLYEGVEFLWSQNKQFAGRVQYDKHLLGEGRLVLNVSRLRTRDSGRYLCTVVTSYGSNTGRCSLSVTAVRHLLEPETPSTSRPQPASRGRYGLYGALGLAGVALLFLCFRLYRQSWLIEKIQSATPNQQDLPEDYEDHSHICTMPEDQELVILSLQEDDSIIRTLPKGQDSRSEKSYSSGYGGGETDSQT
ncbi:hypothetical protein ABVT39_016596 [Epinephelus coioides]